MGLDNFRGAKLQQTLNTHIKVSTYEMDNTAVQFS